MSVIKRLKLQIFCAVIAFVMTLAAMSGLSAFAEVFAATDPDAGVDMYYYSPANAGLENGSFESHSVGDATHSPSSWSGAALGDTNSSNVVSGVVILDGEDFTGKYKDTLMLDSTGIDKELDVPNPKNHQPGESKNRAALMINNPAVTAFAYTSNEITLAPNSHYEFSAYVLTSDFAAEMGAYFKVNFSSGVEKNLSFDKINTNNEWVEYKFYIETSSYKSETVTLSLQNGDYYYSAADNRESMALSKGVCFFYDVNAFTITAENYKRFVDTTSNTVKVKSYINASLEQFENSGFEDDNLSDSTWNTVENNSTGNGTLGIISMTNFQSYKDTYKIKNIPMTADDSDKIFIFKGEDAFNYAIRSSKITLEIAKFYSIRIMVKTERVSGSGVTFKLKGEDTRTNGEFTQTTSKTTSSSSEDNSLFGWEAVNIFISASTLKPCDVYLEIHFGDKNDPQTGTAFVDALLVEEISQSDYNAGGASLSYALDNIGLDNSGIANGFFNTIGEYKEFVYPLPAAGWTEQFAIDADNSDKELNTDNVKSGIVNITAAHYNQNKHNYGNVDTPYSGVEHGPNNLMIYSPASHETVFGYSSEAVSLNANGTGHFNIVLFTRNLTGDKATLIVKRNDKVISMIRNVESTGHYTDYDFYIEGNSVSHSLTLEIWLGNPYGDKNVNNVASGNIFVDSVSYSEISGIKTYAEYEKDYNDFRISGGVPQNIRFAAFSFKNQAFAGYDHLDTGAVKTPYFWTLSGNSSYVNSGAISGGIIDFNDAESKADAKSKGFNNSGYTSGTRALMLRNDEKSYSTLTSEMPETLSATLYYKVSFKVKTVGINPDQYGAYIRLSGADNTTIEGINTNSWLSDLTDLDEDEYLDKNEYKDYSFYIHVGDQPIDINIIIGIGKNDHSKNHSYGTIVVGGVEISEITEPIYNADIADLISEDEDVVKPKNIQYVNMSATEAPSEDPEDTAKEPMQWWVLPSILFGIALIIALVGVPLKSIIKKRKFFFKKKVDTQDRKATMERVKQESLAKLNARIKENEELMSGEDAEYSDDSETEAAVTPADVTETGKATEAVDETTGDSGDDSEKYDE